MCGRATLSTPPEDLREIFGLTEDPEPFPARYNIAPTQPIAVVRQHPQRGERRIHMLRWGLVPFWANDPKIGAKMINARVESIDKNRAFRDAFARRRCLIAVDGFYEWQARGKRKHPFLVRRADGKPFALAGLWARWHDKEGVVLDSCTIVTAPAIGPCADLHDRMPIVVAPASYDRWLDPAIHDRAQLEDILANPAGTELVLLEVSTRVNDVANDDPGCVAPADTVVAPSTSGGTPGAPL